MEHLREDFLKIYANLPLNLRDEIVLVFKGQPMSWDAAHVEVKANTKIGEEILKELKELNFI